MLSQTACRAEAEAAAVMLGSNDLLRQPIPGAEVCAERMERFLAALLKERPAACEIPLIAPPPMKSGAWVNSPKALKESRQPAG